MCNLKLRSVILGFLPMLVVASLVMGARGADLKPISIATIKHEGPVDFESEILPILRRNCLACHNESDAEGDLVMETPELIIKGGDGGPSVVPGDSAKSSMLLVSAHLKEEIMPPDDNDVGAKNLTPEQLGLVKLWIDQGATGKVTGSGAPISWRPVAASVNPIYSVALSPHGSLVAAGRGNRIYMYSVGSKSLVGKLNDPSIGKLGIYPEPGVAHLDLVQTLAFSPDGNWLASGGYRTVKLWKRPQNVRRGELKGVDASATALCTSRDGKFAAVGFEDGKVKLFDVASGNVTKILQGAGGPVLGVAFSADASKLVAGSKDKSFRVYNVADGKELHKIETPAEVTSVAFVVGDTQVATGGADNKIRTWNAAPIAEEEGDEGPKPIKEFAGHSQPITALVAIHVGDKIGVQLLSGSSDGTVRHWDSVGGKVLRTMTHGGPITGIGVAVGGKRFASTSSNKTSKLWDAANGQQVAQLGGDFRKQLAVDDLNLAINLAGQYVKNAQADLAESTKRKKSEEDNLKKGEEAKKKADEDLVKKTEAAKKPEADLVAADAELKKTNEELAKAETPKKAAEQAVTLADENRKKAQEDLKNAKDDEAKKRAGEATKKAEEAYKAATDVKKKADAEYLKAQQAQKKASDANKKIATPAKKVIDERVAAERAAQAAMRSVERGKVSVKTATDQVPVMDKIAKDEAAKLAALKTELAEITKAVALANQPLTAVAFSADGSQLITSGEDQLLHVWSAETGKGLDVLEGQGDVVSLLATASDGGVVAIGRNKSAVVWETNAPWKLARTIGNADSVVDFVDRVISLHFSPDSKTLATGGGSPSRTGELKLWNVADGKLVREFKDAHSDTIFGMEFSPDGKFIATAAGDRFMKVFEVATGKFVRAFEGHTHHVLGVAWRADGRLLASSGADSVVKVWDFRTGDQKKTITGFKKEVTGVQFIGVEDKIIVSSGGNSVSAKTSAGGASTNYSGTNGFMYCVRGSRDGKTVAAAGQNSVVRVWDNAGKAIVNFEAPTPSNSEED